MPLRSFCTREKVSSGTNGAPHLAVESTMQLAAACCAVTDVLLGLKHEHCLLRICSKQSVESRAKLPTYDAAANARWSRADDPPMHRTRNVAAARRRARNISLSSDHATRMHSQTEFAPTPADLCCQLCTHSRCEERDSRAEGFPSGEQHGSHSVMKPPPANWLAVP